MKNIHYNNKLNIIRYIAQENGYNPEIIDRILKNNIHRQTLKPHKKHLHHKINTSNSHITIKKHKK